MRSNQKGQLIFRNYSSADFGIYVETPITIPTPQLDITATHVNGRNGDLLQSYNSFKNITLTVNVEIFKPKQYANLYQLQNDIVDWLTGFNYDYLKFSDMPDWLFEAIVSTPPIFTPVIEQDLEEEISGQIIFNCKPLMLKTPSISWQSVNSIIYNTETMTAIPDWHIVGSGNFVLTVNGLNYQFSNIQNEVYVDGDNCQAYNYNSSGDKINLNSNVTWENNDAPILIQGKNTIALTGDSYSKFEFKPKIRRIV